MALLVSELYLVSGATSGIGFECARAIIKSGASVVALGRSEAGFAALRANLSKQENARLFCEQRDLSLRVDELKPWVLELAKKYAKFKGGVLAAGVVDNLPALDKNFIAKAKELFEVNFFSTLALASGLCDKRAHAKGDKSIVMISSLAASCGLESNAAYAASKGALNSARLVLAKEMARLGVRVNTISPGFVQTPMLASTARLIGDEALAKNIASSTRLGLSTPSDVANLALFLLSPKASKISGADFVLNSVGGVSQPPTFAPAS